MEINLGALCGLGGRIINHKAHEETQRSEMREAGDETRTQEARLVHRTSLSLYTTCLVNMEINLGVHRGLRPKIKNHELHACLLQAGISQIILNRRH
jgi:hypothetical protein